MTPISIVHNDRQLVGKHAVRPAQVKIPAVPGQILGAGPIWPSSKAMTSSGTRTQPQRRMHLAT